MPVKTGLDLLDHKLDGLVSTAVNSADQIVGLGTFYRSHIMGYCDGQPIPDLDSAVTMLGVLFKTIFALYFMGMLAVACSVCFTLTTAREYRQVKLVLDAVGHSIPQSALA